LDVTSSIDDREDVGSMAMRRRLSSPIHQPGNHVITRYIMPILSNYTTASCTTNPTWSYASRYYVFPIGAVEKPGEVA
jgi:hypothetical protein